MIGALTPADVELSKTLGMYTQPGVAGAYPELELILRRMYKDRFQALSFVPADWFANVAPLLGQRGDLLLPIPAYDASGRPSAALPWWLDTDGKRKAWDQARAALKNGYQAFTQKKIDEGRVELNALYAKVEFWQGLENLARAIADAPKNLLFAGLGVLWPYVLLGGLAFIGWRMYKSSKLSRSHE